MWIITVQELNDYLSGQAARGVWLQHSQLVNCKFLFIGEQASSRP